MPKKSPFVPVPVIAQIVTPDIIRYALQVFTQQGYLVTRRRRGVGPPLPPPPPLRATEWRPPNAAQPRVTYAEYQDYWHPILNEVALERSGVSHEEISAWLTKPDHNALTHPTYAPLCLRWGTNPEGVYVQQYKVPAGDAERQLMFVPVWDRESRLTHYEVADPYDRQGHITDKMLAQGLLQEDKYPVPPNTIVVGRWARYSTDWAAIQQTLANYRVTPVLAQYINVYCVGLRAKGDVVKWNKHFYLESEARAYYDQFQANPAYDPYATNEYPRLKLGTVEMLGEYAVDGGTNAEKVLFQSAVSLRHPPKAHVPDAG